MIGDVTIEDTLNAIDDYVKWWKDKPQPYRGVALGQLNHTKRRLEKILMDESSHRSGKRC